MENLEVNRETVTKSLYCRNMENSDSIYREAVTKLKILLSATQISGILSIDILYQTLDTRL